MIYLTNSFLHLKSHSQEEISATWSSREFKGSNQSDQINIFFIKQKVIPYSDSQFITRFLQVRVFKNVFMMPASVDNFHYSLRRDFKTEKICSFLWPLFT